MTAQEKAKELIEKYQSKKIITYQQSAFSPVEEYELTDLEAKFCAGILIDEMIKEISELPRIPYNERRTDFWQGVKKEIDKL